MLGRHYIAFEEYITIGDGDGNSEGLVYAVSITITDRGYNIYCWDKWGALLEAWRICYRLVLLYSLAHRVLCIRELGTNEK